MTKINLILSGGGFKGCYQAAFLHHLQNSLSNKFIINNIYGTSIGGFNGYLYTQKNLQLFWSNINSPFDIFAYWFGSHINSNNIFCVIYNFLLIVVSFLFGFFFKSSIFSPRYFHCLIHKYDNGLPTNNLFLYVHDLTDNLSKCVNYTRKYLYACCAIWYLMPPINICNKLYLDDGIYQFIPIKEILKTTITENGIIMDICNKDEIYLFINAYDITEQYKYSRFLPNYLNNLINSVSDIKRNDDIQLIIELQKYNKNIFIYNINQSLIKNKTMYMITPQFKQQLWQNGIDDCIHFLNIINNL